MKLRDRYTGNVIYCDDSETMEETVLGALKLHCNLNYINFIDSDLRGCNFGGCDSRDCNFVNSNLRDCNFSGCDLRSCDFYVSNLRSCNFRDSDLRSCNFSGSDLRGCNFSGCDLRDCNLSGSDLSYSLGLIYAQMSFSNFGENNRLITLADINRDGNPIFFCGCFVGNNKSLIRYINEGDKEYRKSRHFARKTLLKAIKLNK